MQSYPKHEGVDGRSVPSKDLGGLSASGDPKDLSSRGRASAADITGEKGLTPTQALAEFGGVSQGKKLGSLRVDGAAIDIPNEGQNDASNLKV